MSAAVGARPTIPHGTAAAALALALVAAYAWLASRGTPSDPALLVASGAAERSRIWHGEIWRLLTGPFLHADRHDLVFDCLGLVLAGRLAEREFGRARFLAVYAAAVVGGTAMALLARDEVVVGATGGVFGVLAALLLAHYRALGGLRAFARSRYAWLGLALVANSAMSALLPTRLAWRDLLPPHPGAHVGGFLSGGALAIAATAAPPRWRLALPAAALLGALVVAACWPRPGLTAFEGEGLASRIHLALRGGDVAEAHRLLDEAERGGLRSDTFSYYRAVTLAREGDLEGGLALLRPLVDRTAGPFRDEVRRQIAGIAHVLGYRHHSGKGRARDPWRALAYFEESCAAGDGESCGIARELEASPEVGAP